MKVAYLRFHPCVSPQHLAAALYGSFCGLGLVTFMGFALPYVLLEGLALPQEQIGRVTGLLATFHEIVLLSVLGLIGALADRRGRAFLFPTGLVLIAVTYSWFVLVDNMVELVLARTVYSVGVCMISIMIGLVSMDFPLEKDRGKWIGTTSVLQGIGILISALGLARLPDLLATGDPELNGTHQTFLIVAAICVVSAAILGRGFSGFKPSHTGNEKLPFKILLSSGLQLARVNPKIFLAYACSLVSRADLVVISTFFTLWLQHLGRQQGYTAEEAIAYAGAMFALIQSVALIWGPVWGIVMDRLDRTLGLFIALGIAGAGYSWLGTMSDPVNPIGYAACVLTGMGQISVLLSTQTLIGQEAPSESRGIVAAMSNMCGAVGILITTTVGGFLYDMLSQSSPILGFGLLNVVIMVPAWLVWKRNSKSTA